MIVSWVSGNKHLAQNWSGCWVIMELYSVLLRSKSILANVFISSFKSGKFIYRNLSPDNDDFEEYLSWMRNPENVFVESIRSDISKDELCEFVVEKNSSLNALLIGVFDRKYNQHIANVKFEPIDFDLSNAWMGILLGSPSMRGKGFSSEIIDSSCAFLTETYGIRDIFLGVDSNNTPALNAYKRCNFKEIGLHEKGGVVMVRRGFESP